MLLQVLPSTNITGARSCGKASARAPARSSVVLRPRARSIAKAAATDERQSPEPTYAATSTVSLASQEWFFTEKGQKGWVEAMELDTLTPEMPRLLKEMGLRYDPDKLAAVLADKWPQVYGRALKVAALLGGWVACIAQDAALGKLETNQVQRARELRQLLSKLGPSFVKIGQALSARPDLLPRTYLEILSELQDRLPSFPTEIARTVIEDELGRSIEEMYSEFSEEPVAAASLGQVYRATLRTTGEEVAVKVQRPGIGESIAVDMLLLRRLIAAIDKNALPALGISQKLVPLVDEFAGRLFAELDFIQEGHNAEKFQKLYGEMPRVRTPGINWDYTSRRVLTMEWIEGVKLTNKTAMEAAGLSVIDFVDVGIECTLRQLLEHGYFHADPHPGNLLATTSGDLVYLDFGCMSYAPEYARYAIMSHVVHLVNRDYEAMCKDYYTLQFMDPSIDTSPIAPALAEFFDEVLDQSVSQLNFKAIVDGLGDVLFKYPFSVPSYYSLILRSLTVLEGLALQADPRYKLLAKAYPYMARRLLTDPAPELRESFEDLILKDGQFRWNRLDNLLREGSKSQDFDPSQLWLLAEWLLSPNAVTVRESIVVELSRMVDAVAAGTVRERIIQQTGSYTVGEELVPAQPQEEEALSRATLLLSALNNRVASSPEALPAGGAPGQGRPPQKISDGIPQDDGQAPPPQSPPDAIAGITSTLAGILPAQGSGPFGIYTPQDFQKVTNVVQDVVNQAGSSVPRLQQLMQQPGASDLIQGISSQLGRRFTARVIKLVFGTQQLMLRRQVVGAGQATPEAANK